jgi:hypothetical protein
MSHREVAAPPSTGGGVEGNSRLTSVNGMVLLVLLAVEGFTILSVRQMITLHVYLGVLLVGPVLLKCASTIYRFARYYTGAAEYVRRGAPSTALRLLGPVVIVTSLAVLGTGIALIYTGPDRTGPWLTLHKASFILWFGAMAIHVLGHIVEAGRTTVREMRRSAGRDARRRRLRTIALVLGLLAGVGLATGLMPTAHSWTSGQHTESTFRDH